METYVSEIVLKTKLVRPQVRSRRVLRERLMRRMEEVLGVPLTLVCAPAGYGKTTLLVDWASACPAPVAWLSLDEEENDGVHFLKSAILALQLVQPEVGKSAQAALNNLSSEMLETGFRLLVNDLAGQVDPIALVLDDYHHIHDPQVHQLVAELLDHLPPCLHVVLSSRVEPPINLTRLRARGAVLELRVSDLSFRSDEVGVFLDEVMDLELPGDQCRRLAEQTEGWAAGLQLAGLSLRSGEQSTGPAVLGSGQHYIFEYLAEEVLHRQPLPLQRFLLHTSLLERLTGPLCEQLVEPFLPGESGAACLDALEHANLFVQALDGEHHWYRYHTLFADFLRQELAHTSPEIIPRLHRRAAAWLAEHGAYEEALQHALAGGEVEQAAGIVEKVAESLEIHGELATLARWLGALPESTVRTKPVLSLARAWVMLGKLDLTRAREDLDAAERALPPQPDSNLQGGLLTARALLAGLQGQPEAAKRYADSAIQVLPGEGHYLFCLLKFNVCFPLFMAGEIGLAVRELEAAVRSALQSGNTFIALLSLRVLGEGYILLGRLYQAERVFRQAGEIVEKEMGGQSPLMGLAWLGLGEIYRQRNDLGRARQTLEAGIKATTTWMPALATDGYYWLASLKQSEGDAAGAQEALQQAEQIGETHGHPILDDWWAQVARIRLAIIQGYLEEGLRWARNTGLDLEKLTNLDGFLQDRPAYFRETALYPLARLFLILGQREKIPGALEKARVILARALPQSEARGLVGAALEGYALLAEVEQALGQKTAAQEALHRALDLGAPERPIRVFLDEGEPLLSLLAERQKMDLPGVERAYLEELLAAWGREHPEAPPARPAQTGLVEPLSRRELEVLGWMAEGKSNQEIAGGLVLSLNTVKKHASTILDKLGVKNRTQAVQVAREIGLLK